MDLFLAGPISLAASGPSMELGLVTIYNMEGITLVLCWLDSLQFFDGVVCLDQIAVIIYYVQY